ncbi:MAG: glycosyl transferase GT17 family protein [Elusimicrobia bacterium]|nr:glycosyl transferase GT17 family protein [Elusimicrobiota bacterium]
MRVYDCFQFFNELDLLKLRLNVLAPVVDRFVIVESTVTFSGQAKPLYYDENKEMFEEFRDKITHVIVADTPDGPGVSPFDRDVFQKNARSRGLAGCSKDDVIMYSDLDEIPNPEKVREILAAFDPEKIYQFAQRQFYFYLNLEEVSGKLLSYAGDFDGVKKKQWLGTYLFRLGLLDLFPLPELRVDKTPERSVRVNDGGWHFTYMGGSKDEDIAARVAHKIRSAAHQEFNNEKILSRLGRKISGKKDIFGRSSKFKRVEIDGTYPDYLVRNLREFSHLVLPPENKKGLMGFFKKLAGAD